MMTIHLLIQITIQIELLKMEQRKRKVLTLQEPIIRKNSCKEKGKMRKYKAFSFFSCYNQGKGRIENGSTQHKRELHTVW